VTLGELSGDGVALLKLINGKDEQKKKKKRKQKSLIITGPGPGPVAVAQQASVLVAPSTPMKSELVAVESKAALSDNGVLVKARVNAYDETRWDMHCDDQDDSVTDMCPDTFGLEFREDMFPGNVSTYSLDALQGSADSLSVESLNTDVHSFLLIHPHKVTFAIKDNSNSKFNPEPTAWVRAPGERGNRSMLVLGPMAPKSGGWMHPAGNYKSESMRAMVREDNFDNEHNLTYYSLTCSFSERAFEACNVTKRGMNPTFQVFIKWILIIEERFIQWMSVTPGILSDVKSSILSLWMKDLDRQAIREWKRTEGTPASKPLAVTAATTDTKSADYYAFVRENIRETCWRPIVRRPMSKDQPPVETGDNHFIGFTRPLYKKVWPDNKRGPSDFIKQDPFLLEQYYDQTRPMEYQLVPVIDFFTKKLTDKDMKRDENGEVVQRGSNDPTYTYLDPRKSTFENGNVGAPAFLFQVTKMREGTIGFRFLLEQIYKAGDVTVSTTSAQMISNRKIECGIGLIDWVPASSSVGMLDYQGNRVGTAEKREQMIDWITPDTETGAD
jgi:hypothetical protein